MKVQTYIVELFGFMNEVGVELKKSTWPTRSELVDSTVVVVLSVVGLGAFVGASDFLLIRLVKILL